MYDERFVVDINSRAYAAALPQQMKTLTLHKVSISMPTWFESAANLEEVYLVDLSNIDVLTMMKILKNNRNLRVFKFFGKLHSSIPFEVSSI